MSRAPAMPVFTDALIGDTLHLSEAEFGAYCLILFTTWRNNGVALSDDDARLARVCRVTLPRWRQKLRPVLAPFFDISDGFWHQKRLEKEWNFIDRLRAEQSRKGSLSAAARALKNNNTSSTAVPTELSTEPQPTLNPQSLNPSKGKKKETSFPKTKGNGNRLADDFQMPSEWIEDGRTARERAQLPPADLSLESLKFTNWWQTKTGQSATKRDWRKTWLNWCLNAKGAPNGRDHTAPTAPRIPDRGGPSAPLSEDQRRRIFNLDRR